MTAAVFGILSPCKLIRLANDPRKLRRYYEWPQGEGRVRACYEASGAGTEVYRFVIRPWARITTILPADSRLAGSTRSGVSCGV